MGVYEDIIAWSETRAMWQRHALRRLAIASQLTDHDIDDLVAIALEEAGGPTAPTRPMPFTNVDVPASATTTQQVAILGIGATQNVNALAPDSNLEFAPVGLTIVYGDNGAGKSAYIRVLKRVCRARSTPTRILPNVLVADPRPTSAEIRYWVNGEERTRDWTIDAAVLDELGSVSVFDRECAAVYVTAQNEVAYSPLGLDLLDALAAAAQTVRTRLARIQIEARAHVQPPPPVFAGAASLRGIAPLQLDLVERAMDDIAPWSPEDGDHLTTIQGALQTPGPAAAAAGQRARGAIVDRAVAQLRRIVENANAATNLATARLRLEDAITAQQTATDLASGLPGVGGEIWRAMWAAAAEFSREVVFRGHDFPYVGDDARCVLCGQLYSEAAVADLAAMARLVDATLENQVRARRNELAAVERAVEQLRVDVSDLTLVDELLAMDEVASQALAISLDRARQSVAELDADPASYAAPDLNGDVTGLAQHADALRATAATLLRAADPAGQEELRATLQELRAREWISINEAEIRNDIDRLQLQSACRRAMDTCETQPITIESSQLTDQYVNEGLRDAFAHEYGGLASSRIRIRIVPRGQYGAVRHRLELDGAAVPDASVAEVVSEGEFRAIALASFFAELSQADHQSGVIFDDPVTSLDHLNRERVAARIVEEAARRQVVVFTHDLVFFHDLDVAAGQAAVDVTYRRLRLTPTHVGFPLPEPPWLGTRVAARVEQLQGQLNALRDQYEAGEIEVYEREAKDWYGMLRETWERSIEEVLFGDTLTRYRHEIQTRNLTSNKVWLIEEGDVDIIDRGMTTSSRWLRGHDQPAAVNTPVPEPDSLRDDLAHLRDWVADMRNRRRDSG